MTTTDQLRALLAEATPGPWTESGRDVDHDRFVAEGKNPGDVAGLGCEIEGPPDGWLRGQFHRHADAALIVAAVNALPALFDVVEAAAETLPVLEYAAVQARYTFDPLVRDGYAGGSSRHREMVEKGIAGTPSALTIQLEAAVLRLRAALAKLDGEPNPR